MNDIALVPEYVAAFAAGLVTVSDAPWPIVAGMCAGIGLGTYDPRALQNAAQHWIIAHVDREALRRFREQVKR